MSVRLFGPSQPCSGEFGFLDALNCPPRREIPPFPPGNAGSRSTDLPNGRRLGKEVPGLPTRLCYHRHSPHVVAERGYGRSSGKLNQLRERKMNLREAKAEREAAQGPLQEAIDVGIELMEHPKNEEQQLKRGLP